MISDSTELTMQRRMTDAFIKADPQELVLTRQTRVSNGSGGFTLGAPTPLPSQTWKVVPQNRQLEERETIDGVMVRPDFVLIGYHDADVQRGDWFMWNAHRYDVVYVNEKRDYETRGELVYRG